MNLMIAKAFVVIPPDEASTRKFGLHYFRKPTKRKLSGDDSQLKKGWKEDKRKDVLPPKVLPLTMKTKDAKIKTRLKDVETLLSYSNFVCNGDFNWLQNWCLILT